MDIKIGRVKNFNLLLLFLISILLILLFMTSMFFLTSSLNNDYPFPSILAAALLILFCLPVSIILYLNATEVISKNIFLSLSFTFFLLSLSGVIWYLLPATFNYNFLEPIGMFAMVLSYLPVIIVLSYIFNQQKNRLDDKIKIFTYFVIGIFIILLLYFDAYNIIYGGNPLYILIYSISVAFDAIIIGLTAMLILINMPTQLRYLLSIIFGFDSINFIGDTLNLFKYINLYDSTINLQYFYDATLIFAAGTLLIYGLSNIKVTTIEEVNKKLKDTTLVVEDLIMQSPTPMCISDINGRIIKANADFINTFNIKDNDNIFNINIKTDQQIPVDDVKNGKTVNLDCVKVVTSENKQKFLSITIYPTYTSEKKIYNYIFIAEDITVRKNAENALKEAKDELEDRVKERTQELSSLNQKLQNEIYEHNIDEEKIKTSLKEKEVLLKEIHHRVKNNMQIISSMLGLQSATVKDKNFIDMMKDSQNRIKSMALIHETLYQSNNMASINFSDYVKKLVSNLRYSYFSDNVNFNIDINDNITFNLDTAILLGLIINELATNTLKHAFPNYKLGKVNIEIKENEANSYTLIVKDNGIGLPKNFNFDNTETLGLQLVKVLVEQVNGKLQTNNELGTVFIINFNVKHN